MKNFMIKRYTKDANEMYKNCLGRNTLPEIEMDNKSSILRVAMYTERRCVA